MKTLKLIAAGLCLSMVLSCGNNTGNGALIGGGGGAVLGSIIGAIAGGGQGAAIGAAIGTAVGAGAGALIGHHMDKVKAEIAAQDINGKVEDVKDANGLKAIKVSFDSGLLFAHAKSDLTPASKENLAKLANVMKKYNTCDVNVYGHTDSTGSDKVNDPLSKQRASNVASYLSSCGVSNSQIRDVLGYGSHQPVADNSTEAGRQQNRRVEVYLYASDEMVKQANAGSL